MVILASASPRRKQLLKEIIDDFEIIPSTIDEKSLINEKISVMEIPEFLSTKKAINVYNQYPNNLIIAADTSIIFNNKIYGKPKDKNDAKEMLKIFSNTTHYVVTGVCIISKNKTISFSSINEVSFYKLTEEEIDNYLSTNEYIDKAGSYAIQGKGKLLIKNINGDYNSIVGLPIAEINRILKNFF